MDLTDDQISEITKLQKIMRQCEGIVKTSKNSETINRVKIDLRKTKCRLNELCPDGVPSDLIFLGKSFGQKQTIEEKIKNYKTLSQFPFYKISLYCEDDDINVLTTIIKTWDISLSTAVSEQYLKLTFSMMSERDSFHSDIENIKWQMKTLANSFDDCESAVRQDSKTQLQEIKTRQARNFMTTGSNFLRKLHSFWWKVYLDASQGGSLCTNLDETLHFDSTIQEIVPLLEGKKITEALKVLTTYLEEALKLLNPPNIK